MDNTIHVVSFSTGIPSALSVERVLRKHGSENVYIVFMDTTIEDEDNYRFLGEMTSRWIGVYDAKIIRLVDGRTPFEVAEDQNIIPNQKIAPCTNALKIRQFKQWLKEKPRPLTIHIGFDYTEVHRCKKVSANYAKLDCQVQFPLLWKPFELRPYDRVAKEDWGVEPPRMYSMGYSHANCGGQCVKQGWGDWIRTLVNFPERYAWTENWEQEMRDHPQRKDYAILRDQSKEQVRPKTLKQLREEYQEKEAQQMGGFDFFNQTATEYDKISSCVRCGVGDFSPEDD